MKNRLQPSNLSSVGRNTSSNFDRHQLGILLSSPTKSPTIRGPLCFLILKRAVTLSPRLKNTPLLVCTCQCFRFIFFLFDQKQRRRTVSERARGEIDPRARLVVGAVIDQRVSCIDGQQLVIMNKGILILAASVCVFCG